MHQLTKGLTATSQVAVWTAFWKKFQMDVHLHLKAELQQPLPYNWKHTLEKFVHHIQKHGLYWAVNNLRFPALARMAQKYISAPCSSVETKRLFSSVSHILTDNRSRLVAEHAEMLLFLKKKLPLLKNNPN